MQFNLGVTYLNAPFDPLMENVHSDARWAPFLHRIGKSPTQLAPGKFTVRIPEQ